MWRGVTWRRGALQIRSAAPHAEEKEQNRRVESREKIQTRAVPGWSNDRIGAATTDHIRSAAAQVSGQTMVSMSESSIVSPHIAVAAGQDHKETAPF